MESMVQGREVMETIHPRGRRFSYSLSPGWFHTERPLLERFSAARQDGFGAVELFWPAGVDYRQVAAAARREHVRISMVNMYEGDYARGERGFATDPDRVDEWRARFLEALDFVVLSDCDDINVLAGDIPETRSRAVGMDCLVENMRWAAHEARAQGRRILVEPLNRAGHRNYACRDTAEAMRVVEACRSDNVMLLYDVYHAQLTEGTSSPPFPGSWIASGTCRSPMSPPGGAQEPGSSTSPTSSGHWSTWAIPATWASSTTPRGTRIHWAGCRCPSAPGRRGPAGCETRRGAAEEDLDALMGRGSAGSGGVGARPRSGDDLSVASVPVICWGCDDNEGESGGAILRNECSCSSVGYCQGGHGR